MNDKEMNNSAVYPGLTNPTKANDLMNINPAENNFMRDPTTPSLGAGADPDRFEGHHQAKRTLQQGAGVCEARPGIIESTDIDPLNESSNKDDGWANATVERPPVSGPSAGTTGDITAKATNVAWGAANTAAGAAKQVYGTVLGDEATKQQGRDQVRGKQ